MLQAQLTNWNKSQTCNFSLVLLLTKTLDRNIFFHNRIKLPLSVKVHRRWNDLISLNCKENKAYPLPVRSLSTAVENKRMI